MKLFLKKSMGGKKKKGLVMALITSVLVLAMAVPAMAYYVPGAGLTYDSTKYEGKRVQVTITATHMHTSPHPDSNKVMDLAYNEVLVDSGYTAQYVYPLLSRLYIGGKTGTGMVEGWVRDHHTKVASAANGVTAKARVALSVWSSPTSSTTSYSDIPAGAQLYTINDTFLGYNDGARTRVTGYVPVGGSYVSLGGNGPAYVNTNWASGSVSSYYVQFYQ